MNLSDIPTPLTDALIQRNCQGGYWDANFNTEACKLLRDLERKNAVLREALKNLVPLALIHQTQPENMTETDFYNLIVALSSARATLAATEEKV